MILNFSFSPIPPLALFPVGKQLQQQQSLVGIHSLREEGEEDHQDEIQRSDLGQRKKFLDEAVRLLHSISRSREEGDGDEEFAGRKVVHGKSGKNREENELEEPFDHEKNRCASHSGEVEEVRDENDPNPSRKQREDRSEIDEMKVNHSEVAEIDRGKGELGKGKDLERKRNSEGRDVLEEEESIRAFHEFEEKEESLLESEVQPSELVDRVYS